jgi:hypothetical protein
MSCPAAINARSAWAANSGVPAKISRMMGLSGSDPGLLGKLGPDPSLFQL